jgi:hypothetical protein
VIPSDRRRLIAELVAAHEAEERARSRVAKMGRHIAELLVRGHALGLTDKALARALLRHQHGKFTRAMCQREFERIRKRRRRGTHGPTVSTEPAVQSASHDIASSAEVNTMSRLIKKTVIEEFSDDDRGVESDEELDCADDKSTAAADEDEEEEDEDEDEDDESDDK